jgi:hypothetical protein
MFWTFIEPGVEIFSELVNETYEKNSKYLSAYSPCWVIIGFL